MVFVALKYNPVILEMFNLFSTLNFTCNGTFKRFRVSSMPRIGKGNGIMESDLWPTFSS